MSTLRKVAVSPAYYYLLLHECGELVACKTAEEVVTRVREKDCLLTFNIPGARRVWGPLELKAELISIDAFSVLLKRAVKT